jgi:hypothetical protein
MSMRDGFSMAFLLSSLITFPSLLSNLLTLFYFVIDSVSLCCSDWLGTCELLSRVSQ